MYGTAGNLSAGCFSLFYPKVCGNMLMTFGVADLKESSGVLCLRIYAMYDKSKKILIVLLFCITGSVVSWIAVIVIPIERERGERFLTQKSTSF